MKVNVYDFDKTIYKNDSAVDFTKYTLKKHPLLIIKTLFKSIPCIILYLFHKKDLKTLKENLMSYVIKIDNIENYVEKYWDKKEELIKNWYFKQKKDTDVIISANFLFIIAPICKRLGIKYYLATEFDTKTGKILGKQCRGENKIIMFNENFPNFEIDKTYSDSKTDIPLLEAGKPGYVVKRNEIIEYYKGYFK